MTTSYLATRLDSPRPALLVPDDRLHGDLDPDTLGDVHTHIGAYLGVRVPQWGTAAWFALAPDSHARAAATELAAFAWWSAVVFGSGVPQQVLLHQVAATLKAVSLDLCAAADWRTLARRHVEQMQVLRRRAEPYRDAA